jgi:hypothetical protein
LRSLVADYADSIDFNDKFYIISEIRLSGVAEQGYTMLYEKSLVYLVRTGDNVAGNRRKFTDKEDDKTESAAQVLRNAKHDKCKSSAPDMGVRFRDNHLPGRFPEG